MGGFTWVSVSFSWAENSARSEMDKYCFSRNFFSSELSCAVVKGVRGLRFGLCLRRRHRKGPTGGLSGRSPEPAFKIYFNEIVAICCLLHQMSSLVYQTAESDAIMTSCLVLM